MKSLKAIILMAVFLLPGAKVFAQKKLTKWLNGVVEEWRDKGRKKKWGQYKPSFHITQQHLARFCGAGMCGRDL